MYVLRPPVTTHNRGEERVQDDTYNEYKSIVTPKKVTFLPSKNKSSFLSSGEYIIFTVFFDADACLESMFGFPDSNLTVISHLVSVQWVGSRCTEK